MIYIDKKDLKTMRLVNADEQHIKQLLDAALVEMQEDIDHPKKKKSVSRKIKMELSFVPFTDEKVGLSVKVDFKGAPFEIVKKRDEVPTGQITIDEVIDAEIVEEKKIDSKAIAQEAMNILKNSKIDNTTGEVFDEFENFDEGINEKWNVLI